MLLEDANLTPDKPDRPEPKRAPIGHKLQAFVGDAPAPSSSSSTTTDTPSNAPTGNSVVEALGQAYSNPTVPTPGWAEAFGMTPTEEEKPKSTSEPEAVDKEYDARRTKKMSWDDYLDLNKREKAAVDFNTLLVKARETDLKNQDEYSPSAIQKQAYNNVVKDLFGEDGTSQTYAPETVALLNDIDFQKTDAKRFDDLDDFLGLDAALTGKDLERIGNLHVDPTIGKDNNQMDLSLGGLVPQAMPNEGPRDTITALAGGTADLQQSITRGRQVLENWKRVGAGALNDSIGFYGGIQNKLASPDIRLGQKDDDYFELAYGLLANAGNDPSVLDAIKADLGDGDRYRRFVAYADTKSKYSMDHNVGLGPDPQVVYRSPEQFRQLLGLMEGGESGAADGGRADG